METMLAGNDRVIIERVLGGIGDVCMTRPAINAFIAQNPDKEVYLRTSRPLDELYADIHGVTILLEPPEFNLFDHYDLNSPCLDYELENHPFAVVNQKKLIRRDKNIELSRQEVFCNKVGVKFDISNYNVKFTEQELDFAETYTKGLSNILLVHCNSNEPSRTYKYESALIDYLSKHWDGYILAIRPKQKPKVNNVITWHEGSLRSLWAVMSKANSFIGVDSGPIHMAGSIGIPVYGIFGPIDPAIRLKYKHAYWKPISCKYTKDIPCWYTPCKGVYCMSRYPKEIFRDAISKFDRGEIYNRIQVYKPEIKPSYSTYIYVRPISGIGDAIMLRPVIIENMRLYPGSSHIIYSKLPYGNIYKDIEGLDIININSNNKDVVNDIKSKHDEKETKVFNVYNTCALFEHDHKGHIDKSRQEIWADEVRIELDKLDYNVKFSDQELEYADRFIGSKNIITLHLTSADLWRDYIHKEGLIDFIATNYNGYVFIMDSGYKYYGDRANVIINNNILIRDVWSIVSKSKLLIGIDSAGIHLSGSVGVPTFGLFGPTDPKIRLKYNNVGWLDNSELCKNKSMPCWYQPCKGKYCLDIKPKDVWDSVIKRFGDIL